MLEDHKKLLYPTCDAGQKKLGTTLELLQWKAKNGVSDKGFAELLKIQKKMLPKDNELPSTTYEAKQVVCPLGLEIQKIHACPNDCILYVARSTRSWMHALYVTRRGIRSSEMALVMLRANVPRRKSLPRLCGMLL